MLVPAALSPGARWGKPLRAKGALPYPQARAACISCPVSASPFPAQPRSEAVSRTPAQRLVAILMAVLFSLGGEGSGLLRHLCPHHDFPATMAGMAGGHGVAMEHGGHGAHGAAPAARAGAGEEHVGGPVQHEHGACTCPGACEAGAGAGFALLPAGPHAAVRAVVAEHDAPLLSTAGASPRGVTPYLLPYAHAPPRAA